MRANLHVNTKEVNLSGIWTFTTLQCKRKCCLLRQPIRHLYLHVRELNIFLCSTDWRRVLPRTSLPWLGTFLSMRSMSRIKSCFASPLHWHDRICTVYNCIAYSKHMSMRELILYLLCFYVRTECCIMTLHRHAALLHSIDFRIQFNDSTSLSTCSPN